MSKKNKKFIVKISKDECKGCERCIKSCPKNVLRMEAVHINIMGLPYAEYCGSGCIGCGACFYNCPEPGAVTILEVIED